MRTILTVLILAALTSCSTPTHPRQVGTDTNEQQHAYNLFDGYCRAAENPENTTWQELIKLDDSLWNYVEQSRDGISQTFVDFISDQEYEIDSTYGWTDHYGLAYRIENNIHYWRFKMKSDN